jgi:adenosine deaminase
LAAEAFSLSEDELVDLAAAGVRHAFAPDDERRRLLARVEAFRGRRLAERSSGAGAALRARAGAAGPCNV